ncbi:hypothetical protein E2542_SST17234 [Spatholobus suberectus]|nr:hypothetical protein E2542_SST17234 [Spatholobus suberectus]
MVYKSLGLVVILVLYMPLVVDAVTGFGDEIDRGKIPFSTCLQKCMNICMKIAIAVDSQCQKACAFVRGRTRRTIDSKVERMLPPPGPDNAR